VLDGAPMLLPRLRAVLCELSLVHLYDDQHLWLDVIHRLEAEGLRTWAVQPGFTDRREGRTLQLDAISSGHERDHGTAPRRCRTLTVRRGG